MTQSLNVKLLAVPAGYDLISGPSKGGRLGNLMVREGRPAADARVLKVYRRRKGLARELLARFSHRYLEGKRGPSPEARRDTERLSLSLWRRYGFHVPECFEAAPPAWIGAAPHLWLSFVPGERLFFVLCDPRVRDVAKRRLVRDMAREDRRRHRLALEADEPLLLHEHPTTKHKLVVPDAGLVTIDLEGGYLPGYPILLALSYELAGLLRSMWHDPTRACFEEPWPREYVEAYEDSALMREVCDYASRSLRARGKRWNDRLRARQRSKSAVLDQLRGLVR